MRERREGKAPAARGGPIYSAIVSHDAVNLTGDLGLTGSGCREPAVASDGAQLLVAWQRDNLQSIDGMRISPSGAVVLGARARSPVASGTSDPALAFDGSGGYALRYARGQPLRARRLSTSLVGGAELTLHVGSGDDTFAAAAASKGANRFATAYQRFLDAPPIYDRRVFTRAWQF